MKKKKKEEEDEGGGESYLIHGKLKGMLLLELRVAMEIPRRCCCRMVQHLSLR